MKRSEITKLLLEIVESICCIAGKFVVELIKTFPVLEKYLLAFLFGAQCLVTKFISGDSNAIHSHI